MPVSVPTHVQLLWPTLQAIREMGGSATVEEITEKVIELEGFTEEQQAVIHKDGPRTKIEYRLAWARTYLKGMGALDNSSRGVWSVTEAGRSFSESDVERLHGEYKTSIRAARQERRRLERETDSEGATEAEEASDWREELLAILAGVAPGSFRAPREAVAPRGRVRQRPGDRANRRRWDRRDRHIPALARQLPRLLPVQAVPRKRSRRGGSRLSRGNGRPW